MKDSFWGIFIISVGIITMVIIFFFQELTTTDEQIYTLLRETTESAMYDAIDYGVLTQSKTIKINREKFVENFVRRFAQNATLANTYVIEIYDVNEKPPKVSIKVSTKENTNLASEILEFDIVNKLDAILETPY